MATNFHYGLFTELPSGPGTPVSGIAWMRPFETQVLTRNRHLDTAPVLRFIPPAAVTPSVLGWYAQHVNLKIERKLTPTQKNASLNALNNTSSGFGWYHQYSVMSTPLIRDSSNGMTINPAFTFTPTSKNVVWQNFDTPKYKVNTYSDNAFPLLNQITVFTPPPTGWESKSPNIVSKFRLSPSPKSATPPVSFIITPSVLGWLQAFSTNMVKTNTGQVEPVKSMSFASTPVLTTNTIGWFNVPANIVSKRRLSPTQKSAAAPVQAPVVSSPNIVWNSFSTGYITYDSKRYPTEFMAPPIPVSYVMASSSEDLNMPNLSTNIMMITNDMVPTIPPSYVMAASSDDHVMPAAMTNARLLGQPILQSGIGLPVPTTISGISWMKGFDQPSFDYGFKAAQAPVEYKLTTANYLPAATTISGIAWMKDFAIPVFNYGTKVQIQPTEYKLTTPAYLPPFIAWGWGEKFAQPDFNYGTRATLDQPITPVYVPPIISYGWGSTFAEPAKPLPMLHPSEFRSPTIFLANKVFYNNEVFPFFKGVDVLRQTNEDYNQQQPPFIPTVGISGMPWSRNWEINFRTTINQSFGPSPLGVVPKVVLYPGWYKNFDTPNKVTPSNQSLITAPAIIKPVPNLYMGWNTAWEMQILAKVQQTLDQVARNLRAPQQAPAGWQKPFDVINPVQFFKDQSFTNVVQIHIGSIKNLVGATGITGLTSFAARNVDKTTLGAAGTSLAGLLTPNVIDRLNGAVANAQPGGLILSGATNYILTGTKVVSIAQNVFFIGKKRGAILLITGV